MPYPLFQPGFYLFFQGEYFICSALFCARETHGCPPPTAMTNPFRHGSSPKEVKRLAMKCAPFP
ncbi:hypothetical protein ACE6H2_017335 [Prunus campanulata]